MKEFAIIMNKIIEFGESDLKLYEGNKCMLSLRQSKQ